MNFELNTSRLKLRPLSTKDLSTTHKYATDLEVSKYMIHLPNHNIEETLQFLQDIEAEWKKEKLKRCEFAICLDGKHIGAISLLYIVADIYEIGWILDKEYHGNGYATEAAHEIVRYAKTIGAKQLVAHCDTRNIASRRVMEKLGMRLVCEQDRQYLDERGKAREYMYAMTLSE